MQRLIKISKAYEYLKQEYFKALNSYLANRPQEEVVEEFQSGHLPKWKEIERDYRKVELQFIQVAKNLGKENKLSNKELCIQITEDMLSSNFQSIHQFLLIRLMWDLGKEENQFCIKTLEKWINKILESDRVGHQEEYYLESLIDIWNYDTDQLIPIEILEQIILCNPLTSSKGALIKATSYLSDHPEKAQEEVLAKARASSMYQEDESYRDWID